MTGWPDFGLVIAGGATTLLGGALEARWSRIRESQARSSASRAARISSQIEILRSLHEGLHQLWPDATLMAVDPAPGPGKLREFALPLGRLKSTVQRVQDDTLRRAVSDWINQCGDLVMASRTALTDEQLSGLLAELNEVTRRISSQMRELESQTA